MKKLSLLILAVATIISCNKEHSKEYVTLQGKIENNTDATLTISGSNLKKVIKLNADGSFKDTIKVGKADTYSIRTNSGKRGFLFLDNGYNLTLKGDAKNFMESFEFSGNGAESNNFGVAQLRYRKVLGNPMEYFTLERDAFDAKIAFVRKGIDSIFNVYKDADSALINKTLYQNKKMYSFFESNYEKQHPLAKQRAAIMAKVAKGKPSPKFVGYENFKGGKTSLDDLKGKFVYIDMWATWCGPCIREIPALQKVEKEYHGKNIEFVSISTDSDRRSGGTWDKAHAKWKKFVSDRQLTGMQLWAGKDYGFRQDYQINSIPRFILLDPKGNIVDNNAPRPSNPELKKLFTELGI